MSEEEGDEGVEVPEDSPVIKKLMELDGVGEATALRLYENEYTSYESLSIASAEELSAATGLSVAVCHKIINSAREKLNIQIITADDLEKMVQNRGKITTGSSQLDDLLGGGVPVGEVTEFYGEGGSGKTQLAIQLAVNVMLPKEKGGLDGNPFIIDSEKTFNPKRFREVAAAAGLDPDEALKRTRIYVARATDDQMATVEKILMDPDNTLKAWNTKLVVVDSVIGFFRSSKQFQGREHLADRQQKLNRHLHDLTNLADVYNVAVVVTNQIMSRPDVFFGNPNTSAGGNIMMHGPNNRINLRRSKGGLRIAHLVDSSYLPEGEAVFEITPQGIRDPKKRSAGVIASAPQGVLRKLD
ncbi:MAG: DNA repair and recombination protein RadA [Candidatus Marsarchaeota archaeon]